MVARLAALGALDAEGTSLHLCCLCLIVRSQESLSVVKTPGNCVGGFLRWSTGWSSHGCVHHTRFGAAGVQELLPAKEIPG